MPRTCIDTADAIELAETLQLIARWLTADPERLAASMLDFIGHPAYGPDALHADLDRFTFLLGGNDGEFLFGDDPDLPRHLAETTVKTHLAVASVGGAGLRRARDDRRGRPEGP
jgi:hypothetical protein